MLKSVFKWTRRLLGVLLLFVLVFALALTFGWKPEPFPPGSQAAQWLENGPNKVARLRLDLLDSSRPTAANGDYAGQASRHLETDVFYPLDNKGQAAPGHHPVVLYLHGLASWKEGGQHFSKYLASHGYIVVAADFPLTNFFSPGGANPADVINQPGDASFLIDQVLRWNEDSTHPLSDRVDGSKIALVGYSLGGLTATLATFHPRMRDSRVAATVSIAGPSSMFNDVFFAHSSTPFLMLAGDVDALVDYPSNAGDLPGRAPAAQVVSLKGGSHLGFISTAPLLRWLKNPDAVGCMVIRHVLDGVSADELKAWSQQLGSVDEGIMATSALPCPDNNHPKAMNAIRQTMLAKVTLLGFLESQFAALAQDRRAAARFLASGLPAQARDSYWQGPSTIIGEVN